ncbi:MAG: alpha-L-fucosidase [Armatimonadetes bacterium]|nr:alpha-L-fucosidase [Armatimonadota bacterium]
MAVEYTTHEESLRWFSEAKLGMFVHFGLYAILGRGEWRQLVDKIPCAEYDPLIGQFNPSGFHAEEWVNLAREAGCQYLTITTKHHDGFCLYDTKLTDFQIMNSPFGRDLIAELTEACHAQGLRMHYYYSILDWHHPDFSPPPEWMKEEREARGLEPARYLEFMKGQLRELCTNYGPIGCIWYDGGWLNTAEQLDAAAQNAMIRELQPHILINDRSNLPEDLTTPEQRLPATGLTNADGSPRRWEACLTITSHWWGYDQEETNYKSPSFVLRTFVDIVSKGGNLLLNVGPKPDGTIQEEFVAVFQHLGRWMRLNSEAIYGASASPFRRVPFFGRVTAKGKTLYLHVFNWPLRGLLRLDGLKTRVLSARLLAGPEAPLEVQQTDQSLLIGVPTAAPDPDVSVVVLELEAEPEVEQVVIRPANGVVCLPALYADVHGPHGQRARLEVADRVVQVGNWINAKDQVAWDFELPAAGVYEVVATYACPPEQAGATVAAMIRKDESWLGPHGPKDEPDNDLPQVTAEIPPTAGWDDFQELRFGTLSFEAGLNYLVLKPREMPNGAVMALRQVELREVR